MKTITTPDFIGRIAKIVEEVSARAYVEEIDTEGIKEILKEELKECYAELKEYYEEEGCIAISRARNSSYYDGHSDGYSLGYDDGHDECYEVGYDAGQYAV